MKTLIAIPVFNEQRYLHKVLKEIRLHAHADILVIDDGSTDATPDILRVMSDIFVLRHGRNMGYGRSLIAAFDFAARYSYQWVITMDCDEQHEPAALPEFIAATETDAADIISGSRYLLSKSRKDEPPLDRRLINQLITDVINRNLNFNLTDSFCGFKAQRVSAMQELDLSETGYAFPMELWVRAAQAGLRVSELPIRLIYNDPDRHFGGRLDDPNHRLRHYLDVFFRALHSAECRQTLAAG
ncbi:MAG: glycosyltransferase family 2 protein [Phycisphaerae bacterium]